MALWPSFRFPHPTHWEPELRQALYRGLQRNLYYAGLCLSVLFSALVVVYFVLSPANIAHRQIVISLVSALAMLVVTFGLLRRGALGPEIEPITAAVGMVILINGLIHLRLTGDLIYTLNVMVLAFGSSLFFITPLWAGGMIGLSLVSWIWASWPAAEPSIWRWLHFGSALLVTAGLSTITYLMRMGTLDELNLLIRLNEQKNRHLRDALQVAEESQLRFRRLAEATFEGVLIHDRGIILDANESLARMSGYSLQELIGKNGLELVVPEDRDKVMKMIETGDERLYEVTTIRKDGTLLPVQLCGKNLEINGRRFRVVALRDISAWKEAEAQIRKSLREKEWLLKEIHHRVKNNLQIISSLLSLQARSLQDRRIDRFMQESESRIRSIALVHEILYNSRNLAGVRFDKYAARLIESIKQAHGRGSGTIEFVISVAPVTFNMDLTITCGLIINELVTNALKYAFPDQREGRIAVRLDECADGLELAVIDNGIGMKKDAQGSTPSLGLLLVETLAEQIQGKLFIENANGTAVKVRFPRPIQREGTAPLDQEDTASER